MAVFRTQKNSNYTVMSNYHLKEKCMSLKAKGLLSMILSFPDDWDYSLAGLIAICKENETAVRSALKELEEFGYLRIDKYYPDKTKTGRIEYVYNVFESPKQESKKQDLENLYVENQYVENQVQLNTKQLNTNKSSIVKSKDLTNTNNFRKPENSKRKSKKEKYLDKVLNKLEEYQFSDNVKEKLLAFYEDRIEKSDYPADNQLELSLNVLAELTEEKQIESINNSIMAGYRTFYKPNNSRVLTKKRDANLKDNYSNLETEEERKARLAEMWEKAENGEDGYHIY